MKLVLQERSDRILKILKKEPLGLKKITDQIVDKGTTLTGYRNYMNEMNKIRHCLKLLIDEGKVEVTEDTDAERSPYEKKRVYQVRK